MVEQQKLPISILGVGSCVPKGRLTNKDLEGMVDTTEKWLIDHIAIKERSISTPEENVYVLSALAAKRALEDANLSPEDIDAIYVGTNITGEFAVPGVAHIVQYLIGAENASASDVCAGCSGGIYAMENGYGKILLEHSFTGKQDTKILVLAGDTLSTVTYYKDRNTCPLLADGAGALVLGTSEQEGILSIVTGAIGKDGYLIYYRTGFRHPISTITLEGKTLLHEETVQREFFDMTGPEVYKFGVRILPKIVQECISSAGLGKEETLKELILIPHQANLRILESAAKRLGLPMEKVYHWGIENIGNTSAASVIIGLDDMYRKGELGKGQKICSAAFGGGLTWGGVLERWQKEKYTGESYSEGQQEEEITQLNKELKDWKNKLHVRD